VSIAAGVEGLGRTSPSSRKSERIGRYSRETDAAPFDPAK
jgi:hypothetical protein